MHETSRPPHPHPFRNLDPYAAYLKDIKETRKLSPEEEKILARRIRQGDGQALRALVEANLKFVILVCKRYRNQGLPMADLVSEGNLGLIRAALRFDETRDLKFISYAVWWIRQGVLDSLSKHSRPLSGPPNTGALIHTINKATRRLEQKLGRQPTAEELELEIGIHARRIRELQRISEPMLSLDYSAAADHPDLHARLAADPEGDRERDIGEARELAEGLLASLEGREKEILTLYFGTRNGHPMSLEEIANRFLLSKERIRQLRNQGLLKLRKIFKLREIR